MNKSNNLKIVFAGTPEFAAKHLEKLHNAGYKVDLVMTQPDKKSGRGMKIQFSQVKTTAIKYDIPIIQPKILDQNVFENLKKINPDIIIVVAYGLLFPQNILDLPRFGCINVHASLLPRWRGAAPIQHAILSGDKFTGISIMQMEKGLDTGPVMLQTNCPIENNETFGMLSDKLMNLGASSLLQAISLIENNNFKFEKQNDNGATYAHKIQKIDTKINWNKNSLDIYRQILAYNPMPIAHTQWNGDIIKIWEAEIINNNSQKQPGNIINIENNALDISTQNGILRIKKLQLPGSIPMSVQDILKSKKQLFIQHSRFD